jgi:hypothetical protein
MATKPIGWKKQPKRHSEAYYKGKRNRLLGRSPTASHFWGDHQFVEYDMGTYSNIAQKDKGDVFNNATWSVYQVDHAPTGTTKVFMAGLPMDRAIRIATDMSQRGE